jgi:hypothetical protein
LYRGSGRRAMMAARNGPSNAIISHVPASGTQKMKIDFVERRSFVLQGARVVIESELCSGNYTMEHGQHLGPAATGGMWDVGCGR